MRILIIAALASLTLNVAMPSGAHAKLFSNSYVSFELPDRWVCALDVEHKTEWVCRSEIKGTEKEAVIILTAKEVGPGDSLPQYEAYLKTPKTIADASGKPMQSKVKEVKTNQINGQPWVDGWHLASEVPFYYTRYLATVKQRIAVLVTFSAHQRFYTKYSQDFFRAIQSLRVTASASLLSGSAGLGGLGGGQTLGAPSALPQDMGGGDLPEEPRGSSSSKRNMMVMAILLAAIGGYFILNKKKPPKNPFG